MALRDIIQMLGTVSEMKRYQQAAELAQQHETTSAYGEFMSLLPQLRDPAQLAQSIQSFSATTGIPIQALAEMAQGYQPSAEVQRASTFQQYRAKNPSDETLPRETAYAVGTGQTQGSSARSQATVDAFSALPQNIDWQDAFRSQVLAGMGAGDVALQANLMHTPIQDLTHYNRIRYGTEISAPDVAHLMFSGTESGEKLNQGDREIASRNILGLIESQSRGGQVSNEAIDAATKRYTDAIEKVSTTVMSPAGQVAYVKIAQENYDRLHGPGSFLQAYPEIANVFKNPNKAVALGTLANIFYKVIK